MLLCRKQKEWGIGLKLSNDFITDLLGVIGWYINNYIFKYWRECTIVLLAFMVASLIMKGY